MKRGEVDTFFQSLSQEWNHSTQIILLGGAAALLLGGVRPTLDVDFQFKLKKKVSFEDFSSAVAKVVKETGMEAQFSDHVDRWSSLSFLDFEKHLIFYKKFGGITVYLLHPLYWSLGKIARYLVSDCQDLIEVLRKNPVAPLELARLWRKALEESPRSEQLPVIKKYMVDFFTHYGKTIWGKDFILESILKLL